MIDLEHPLRELDRQIEEVREHLYGHTIRLAQLMVQKECLLDFNEMVRSGAMREHLGREPARDEVPATGQDSSPVVPGMKTKGRAAEIVLGYLRDAGSEGASAKDLNEAVKRGGLTDAAADKAKTRLKKDGQVQYDLNEKKYYAAPVRGLKAQSMANGAA